MNKETNNRFCNIHLNYYSQKRIHLNERCKILLQSSVSTICYWLSHRSAPNYSKYIQNESITSTQNSATRGIKEKKCKNLYRIQDV